MIQHEYLVVTETYATYRPVGETTRQQAIEIVALAIAHAREQNIAHLLIDTTRLTGFAAPNTLERFSLGSLFARSAQGTVKVAFVAKAEMIDPQKFGLMVARNRGMTAEVFTDEAATLVWLLQGVSGDESTSS